jgi:hypothetical protein
VYWLPRNRLTVQQLEEGNSSSKSITVHIAKDQLVTYADGALADYLEQESAELQAAAAAWRRPSTGSTAAAAAAAAERRRSSSSSSNGEPSGVTSSSSIPGLTDAAMDCRWQDVQAAAAASSHGSSSAQQQQQTERTLLYYFSDVHPVLLACHRLRWLMITWDKHGKNDQASIQHLGEYHTFTVSTVRMAIDVFKCAEKRNYYNQHCESKHCTSSQGALSCNNTILNSSYCSHH